MSKRDIGMKRMREILGDRVDTIVENFEKVSPDFGKYIVEFCYGDIYARSGLADKTREVAAVASLMGQGNTGLPLKSHLEGMLNVGWSQTEVIELIIFLAPYVGFPTCVEAIFVARELFEKRG